MKIAHALTAVLIACSFAIPGAVADDKKKLLEYQQKQLEAQQQWKLQQMRKQQQLQQTQQGQPRTAVRPPAVQQANAPVKLSVTNRSGVPVELFWVAGGGSLQSFGTINPGQPFVQETFAGHSWQFRVGRQVVKSYVASSQPVQQVVIGNVVTNTNPSGAAIREPFDVSTGNGVVIQRQQSMPVDVGTGAALNNRTFPPPINGSTATADATHADPRVAAFLQVHNDARAEVGVGPLQWSDKLAQAAQQWANQLSAMGRIMHNPQTPYGENWAAQSGSFSPAAAAQMWLGEKTDFRRGQLGPGNAGHYTQMVWRRTTHVGFGVAVVNGMTVVVANYEPAGNYTNQPPF